MKHKPVRFLKLLLSAVLLASCTTMPPVQPEKEPQHVEVSPQPVGQQEPIMQAPDVTDAIVSDIVKPPATARVNEVVKPNVKMGTGVFVSQSAPVTEVDEFPAGDVTLNFENSSLREFIGVIIGDILKENYLIDPKVDGVVTLHATRPVSREAVLPILESVLEQNAAALVMDQGVYKVVPMAGAEGEGVSPVVGNQPVRSGAGYGVQIVPLVHVAAKDVEAIIKPFVPTGSAVRVDPARNLLILSGPRYRLDQIMETIEIFDVDWLKGMSFGLFPLQYADAATLVGELQQVIGSEGQSPFASTVRLVPVARLNAVLVISHQPRHLAEVRKLIEQFDWGSDSSPGQRLHVYYLENGKAENIAGVLQELYGQTSDVSQDSMDSSPDFGGAGGFRSARELSTPVTLTGMDETAGGAPLQADQEPVAADSSVSVENRGPVTIIADQDNNAILVLASPGDYRAIEAAIRKLDIPPRQVLINATIAEVTLSNGLDHGVRWFLDGGSYELGFNAPPPTGAGGEGLTLALLNSAGDVRLFFDLLATESGVKFLSAPQVLVRDNQTATIRVGDQIPVTVRSSQSTINPDSPLVAEVQYRDTGTLLTVTPRINVGGQVTLEVSQEVSLPGTEPAIGGGGNVSIAQRSIDSTVTVQSGQTVVMGGLIREVNTDSVSGIPVLMTVPYFGNLFSTKSRDVSRTELLVTINPVVVEDQHALQAVTRELRSRMHKASAMLDKATPENADYFESPTGDQ